MRNKNKPHSAAFDAVGSRPRQPQPRPVKQLSWELANHAKAYLEAENYANGYIFLESLLSAGTSISVPAKPYVGYLAPAIQIALASTLVVYPHMTTKARSVDAVKGPDAALHYLRSIRSTITDPAYTVIRKAFAFPEDRVRRRGNARVGSESPNAGNDVEQLTCTAANARAVWTQAEDFWHVVGWAFNCSVAHHKRWKRWKLWLDIMLDFLEADWEVCVRASKNSKDAILRESLIWQYISSQNPGQRSNRRRIVRAILSTATSEDLRHYPEVWERETAELKPRNDTDRPVAQVDIEAGELGDFEEFEHDDGEDQLQVTSTRATRAAKKVSSPDGSKGSWDELAVESSDDAIQRLGGADAMQLRQRLINLLAEVALTLPSEFSSLGVYFDLLTEEIRHLPTRMLSVFLATSTMPGLLQLALNANSLLPLVTDKLPDYTVADPCQSHLETILLPLRANSQRFAANAKVSLILEQIFMYMMDEGLLEATEGLREAVETGIASRQKAHGASKGKKGITEEAQAKEILGASSERLFGLLEILAITAGKEPQPKANELSLSFISATSALSSAPESSDEMED